MFIAVSALVGYGLLVWQAPQIVVGANLSKIADAAQRATAEYNARVQVVSIAGAVVVAIGLAFTARTYALNRRGQVTERFSKALERLGSDELYVRIGGVHALEHVMADSASHHADVVEVLVAFVRERAPRSRPRPLSRTTLGRWMHPPTPHEPPQPALPYEPAPDVQAALTTLARRPTGVGRGERTRIDLSRLHLTSANLNSVNLASADLTDADLARADLTDADLNRANLTRAYLIRADLTRAKLIRADLTGAFLTYTNLTDADLLFADLTRANLTGADLTKAFHYHRVQEVPFTEGA